LDQPASLSAEHADRTVTLETAGDIHYDTWGGRDHYRPAPPVKVTFAGNLWRVESSGLSRIRRTKRPAATPTPTVSWLCGGFDVALMWLWGGFEVALGWL
jgi:hypothetical protein